MFSEATSNEDLAKMLCNLARQHPPTNHHHHSRSGSNTSASVASTEFASPIKEKESTAAEASSSSCTSQTAVPVKKEESPYAVATFAPTSVARAASPPPPVAPAAAAPPAASSTAAAAASIPPPAAAAGSASSPRPPSALDDLARRISLGSSMSSTAVSKHMLSPTTSVNAVPAPPFASHQQVSTAPPQQQHLVLLPPPQQQQQATVAQALSNHHTAATALPSFPVKLYEMMQDSGKDGFEDVVSWQPSLPSNTGNTANSVTASTSTASSSFKVHSTDRFVNEVMPKYFKQTKFKSFQRQLNIYGFQRIHDGPNRGGYMHPYFQQGAPELLKLIPRKRAPEQQFVTARGNQHPSPPPPPASAAPAPAAPAPAVSSVQRLLQALNNANSNTANPTQGISNDQLVQLLQTAASVTEDEATRQRVQQNLLLLNAAQQFPPATLATAAAALGAAVASVSPPAASNMAPAPPTAPASAALPNPSLVKSVTAAAESIDVAKNQHVFPWKLYKMLEEAELPGSFSHIVSWVQGGKSFKVHNTKEFVSVVMPQYFDQTKYESFRRQLNLYGFTRIVRGQHRGVYSHPLFQRGHKEWCQFITRNQASQTNQHNAHNDDAANNSGMAFPLPPVLGKGGAVSDGSPTSVPNGISPRSSAPAPKNFTNRTGV